MRIYSDYVSDSSKAMDVKVESTAVLRPGQVLKMVDGKAVKADTTETGAVVGVCLENHPGAADSMNKRSNGEYVRAACSPSALYACKAPVIMAYVEMTGGICDTSMSAAFPENIFAGGHVRRIGDGKVFEIKSNGVATKTLDIDGDAASGDKFEVFPPEGFVGGALDSEAQMFSMKAYSADFALRIVGCDIEKGEIYLAPNKHEYANARG